MVVYFNQKVEIMKKKPKTSTKIILANNSNGRTKLKIEFGLDS